MATKKKAAESYTLEYPARIKGKLHKAGAEVTPTADELKDLIQAGAVLVEEAGDEGSDEGEGEGEGEGE